MENEVGIEEAAKILRLSPTTVRVMCAKQKLFAWKRGRAWVLDKLYCKGYADGFKNGSSTRPETF